MQSTIEGHPWAGESATGNFEVEKAFKDGFGRCRPFRLSGFDMTALHTTTREIGRQMLMQSPKNNHSRMIDHSLNIQQLEFALQSQLRGRVRRLRLVAIAEGIVLKGEATTFHAKQLAQHEAMKVSIGLLITNEIKVSRRSDFPEMNVS